MSYIDDSLSKGETIYRVFEFHWIIRFFLVLHVILCVTLIWIPVALYYWLTWRCTEQGVTNKRVIHKSGIIARKTDEMKLGAIEAIEINQGIWGRILGFGTLTIYGRGDGDVVMKWMARPVQAKRDIESADYPVSATESD
ncbi:PH domain-containing protein [Oceanobacter sp. 3_MG-2023]|uniref:PH domain-containing protein n=1 Tax=Oceanobacter sp. 3_MG-2023 TaxID=3062622 RepID=UPI002732DFC2|nr:PH domain-containing protein [Oceanobacter sp. 3_MG-2023]MDP2505924.1 PH domain-containing protein [Oceanobacter sp. 3_MG-2023]